MWEKINSLISIIKNTDGVDFAEFGNGTTEEWIAKAEERLHFAFPESYKWWLKKYGGGEVFGDEIFSIYELDFDSVIGGDIVYINELNRKKHIINDEQLTICENDMGMFYFQKTNDGKEYPVMLNGVLFSSDFIEFLIKFIKK